MSQLDVKKIINQPYSGDLGELNNFVNKLRIELVAFLTTLKSIKKHEKVVVYDSYGPLYIGRLAAVDPTTLNVFLLDAYNVQKDYTVPKVLIRGDVVKRIEYVTDAELHKIFVKLKKKEKE